MAIITIPRRQLERLLGTLAKRWQGGKRRFGL